MRTLLYSLIVTLVTANLANSSELTQKIDAAMNTFVAKAEISGAVTMAIHKGEVIHFSAVGMADREKSKPMAKDTLFRIASLTKNYSAVLVKILEEQGKLNVQDKVEKYLPEFKNIQLKQDDGKGEVDLRIWHLMTHTSGVDIPANYHATANLEGSAKAIASKKLHFRPGSEWKYSKGMDVCGRIVEVLSGQKFEVFLKEQILDPLGLKDTGYSIDAAKVHRLALIYMPNKKNGGIIPISSRYLKPPTGENVKPNPSSGLISSTRDVGVYYTMLLNGGVYNGTRIISEASVKDLTRNWTKEMKTNPVTGTAWGLGFGHIRAPQGVTAALSSGSYGHGGAFGTQAWVDPKTEVIYILMIQRRGFGNGDMADIRGEFQRIVAQNYASWADQ